MTFFHKISDKVELQQKLHPQLAQQRLLHNMLSHADFADEGKFFELNLIGSASKHTGFEMVVAVISKYLTLYNTKNHNEMQTAEKNLMLNEQWKIAEHIVLKRNILFKSQNFK